MLLRKIKSNEIVEDGKERLKGDQKQVNCT